MAQLEISIGIANTEDGSQQVYLAKANTLSVRLTNKTGSVLQLTGGQPEDPPPQGGASNILLDFSELYATAGEQSALSVTATGWTSKFFPGGDFPLWSISPDASTTWNPDDVLVFTVSNLTPTAGTGSYYISLDLYNTGGQYDSTYTVPMMVSNKPSGAKNLLDFMGMEVIVNPTGSFEQKSQQINYIGITKIPSEPYVNEIQIRLYNKSSVFPITTSWPVASPPQLTVSFVPADEPPGFFALTTPDGLKDFEVKVMDKTVGWQTSLLPGTPARWSLSPLPTNQNILGTSPNTSIAQFSFANVRTSFTSGPTIMYLQYANIPGYNDGFMAFLLEKEYAAMNAESFYVTPDTLNISDYLAQTVSLNWKVVNSTYVEISGVGKVDSTGASLSVPAVTNQTFVLTAYDMIVGQIQTRTAKLVVNPPISRRWTRCGTIAVWSGSASDIPPGWKICDGSNGTPDLRDVFIVGAGASRTAGQSDRFPTHKHPLPGFNVTAKLNETGDHEHRIPSPWYARGLSCGKWSAIDAAGNVNVSVQTAGRHGHDLFVNFSGTNSNQNNQALLPNWYALCYIMMTNPH